MRRAVLTTTGTSALILGMLFLKPHQPSVVAGGPAPSAASPQPQRSEPASAGGHGAATGTFTGAPVATPYGTVQVAATLTGGKITAVRVLQAPDENGRDRQIASYALPRLTQEALGAQSARIDAVSGASYTSQGYVQSLQSALDQARA
ncbi:FMN-binding protein [Actinacidiphila glaucinigra]|uniref:FMN-binding protein n=1 Tax=Actinacidiphila glaucinigra TaxID=235986 RepID=UPI002E31C350|nr:FMN-binding protein [Actinacidiphila glaucinigra]